MDTPFEEILEKAKAGDPKAQTEVRTSIHGEARAALPSAWEAQDKLVLSVLVGVGAACLHLPHAGPVCGGSMFVMCCFSSHHPPGSMYVFNSVQLTPELGHHLL